MPAELRISAGQYSDRGRKDSNQDFHGIIVPREPQLSAKGIAVALADGISSSEVSALASQAAVTGFLEDYFSTSDTWSVKKSAQRVLYAINSWLHAQTRQSAYRYEQDKGYVCTFSALVIKAATAHVFHLGDARIYRLRGSMLEQLTEDHRVRVSAEKSYLGRALGINPQLEIDYQSLAVEPGDVFLLATDGVYEHLNPRFMAETIAAHTLGAHGGAPANDLDAAARRLVGEAYAQGSEDNLTVQIVRIDELPAPDAGERLRQLAGLPFAPALEPRMLFDGYRIVREVHASSRSHACLAIDEASGEQVLIKTPATDLRNDPAAMERFLTEEWIARRVSSAHALKAWPQTRKRNFLYIVTEFIEGRTLTQWMIDHPKPDLETVRGIVAQIAKGLQALHRLEMVHQDLRPENIMIDTTGTARIIDFGATRVAGLAENAAHEGPEPILGTEQYAAPEYFLGEDGTSRADIFSLGVIAYQMLTGRLPYGADVSRARTGAAQRRLAYRSARDEERAVLAWVDEAIRRAVHPDPWKRYAEVSEFVYDLHHPNPAFVSRNRVPLLERHPETFWKGVSIILALIVLVLLASRHVHGTTDTRSSASIHPATATQGVHHDP